MDLNIVNNEEEFLAGKLEGYTLSRKNKFDKKEMKNKRIYSKSYVLLIIVPTPSSVKSSSNKACSIVPSII